VLKDDGENAGKQNNRKKREAELRTAGKVGCPVARVHVADRDKVAGAGKGEELSEKRAFVGNDNGSVHVAQTFGRALAVGSFKKPSWWSQP